MLLSPNDFSRKNSAVWPSPSRVYTAIKEGVLPVGVAVRIGRKLFINETKYEAFVDAGGAALPGGWKRQPEGQAA